MEALIRDLLKELADGRAYGGSYGGDQAMTNKVLELIKENGKISAAQMAERLGISQRQVQRIISQLKDDGVIERIGANRNGEYRVIE